MEKASLIFSYLSLWALISSSKSAQFHIKSAKSSTTDDLYVLIIIKQWAKIPG